MENELKELKNEGGRDWLTLNSHGKNCLKSFLCAISGTDVMTTQMDYLWDKDIVEPSLKYDTKEKLRRHEIANKCLTDLGIKTAKHYFPKFSQWI
jgi:hypothetical protein